MNYKRSQQREKIYQILKSTRSHPTADWIYEKLKPKFPRLSLGTVYRNLNILVEQGKVRRITFGSTFDRFDANIKPHYHFICVGCGAIIDLDMPVKEELEDEVEKLTGFQVRYHTVEFYGLCDKCKTELEIDE